MKNAKQTEDFIFNVLENGRVSLLDCIFLYVHDVSDYDSFFCVLIGSQSHWNLKKIFHPQRVAN